MLQNRILCKRCGKRHPLSNMKYFQDAKNLVCVECIEKIRPKEAIRTTSEEKRKIRFKCQKCNHVFMLREDFNKQCPYCGDLKLENQEWNSDLDTLIDESASPKYDY